MNYHLDPEKFLDIKTLVVGDALNLCYRLDYHKDWIQSRCFFNLFM